MSRAAGRSVSGYPSPSKTLPACRLPVAYAPVVGTLSAMRATRLTINGRDYVTCCEAAKAIGCTMGYIRQQARSGRLRAVQIGRTWVVDAAEIRRMKRDGAGGMAKGFSPG